VESLADAMRQNAGMMDKLVQDKRAKAATMTPSTISRPTGLHQAHLDGLKNLTRPQVAL